MSVVVITRPPDVAEEMYDAVNEKLGEDMPHGLLVHSAGRTDDGTFQIVDVWESREAHDEFSQGRLWEAISAVMRENGMDPEGAPEPERIIYEARAMRVRQPQHA
jgi:heme-degrading monooxygenase HmoA